MIVKVQWITNGTSSMTHKSLLSILINRCTIRVVVLVRTFYSTAGGTNECLINNINNRYLIIILEQIKLNS